MPDKKNDSKEEIKSEKTLEKTEEYLALEKQFEELTDTLKRIQAEFENYKKRTEKENLQIIKNSNASLIRELLPVMDSFELAIKNSNGNEEIQKFKKGLELIYAQFYTILEDEGLRVIDAENKHFDPFKHEVLMVKECENPEEEILQEFQKGYMLNDMVLRHSKVMIAKHKQETKNGQS